MATGLDKGEGSCGLEPSQGLTPACLPGALRRGGAEALGNAGGGFQGLCSPWLSPSPGGHLNGTVCQAVTSGSLFSACQSPGYQGERLTAGGEQAER